MDDNKAPRPTRVSKHITFHKDSDCRERFPNEPQKRKVGPFTVIVSRHTVLAGYTASGRDQDIAHLDLTTNYWVVAGTGGGPNEHYTGFII